MAPSATLLHRGLAEAVGPAANARNVAGSTPRSAANVPFTRTRAALTARAARTPRSRATRATSRAGRECFATTITSARSSLPGVAAAVARADAIPGRLLPRAPGPVPRRSPRGR